MKYKCKENDAIIELSKSKDEILICIDGEKSKTVIGLKDLHNALKEFGLNEDDIYCNTCKNKGFIKLSDGMNNCPDCYSEPVTK